jgi:hypothetical protein
MGQLLKRSTPQGVNFSRGQLLQSIGRKERRKEKRKDGRKDGRKEGGKAEGRKVDSFVVDVEKQGDHLIPRCEGIAT